MSDFGDFTSEQAQGGDEQQAQDSPYVQQDEADAGEPIALPPPGDDSAFELGEQPVHDAPVDEDAFGLSSPPAAAVASSSSAQGQGGELEEDDDELDQPQQEQEQEQLDNDPFATVDGGSSSNAGAFDSFSNNPVEAKEEEAAALQKWENDRARVLSERASKAAADKQALLAGAKEELAKFYADRDAQVAKQQKTNRADEKNYRSDMKATFESGARWEKVNKLISTAPRPQEKAGTSRVDRMRKLLIQLKAEKKQ